jgi:hypothetical protein
MADDGADPGRGEGRAGGLGRAGLRDRRKPSISVLGREDEFNRHGDNLVPQALACPQNTD